MLVLTRKPGEKVTIGEGIVVTVLSTEGGRIRLGIEAPDHVLILRGELSSSGQGHERPSLPAKG